ncbi:MAG: metallophosphoesterase family protein [Flavobacteriales bacterium]|nr:metallophosphoesterase family protein [Flavobacteriales bacterium]
MKRILLLSDTHGYLDERILSRAAEHDQIWHAGDWGSIGVFEKLSELRPVRGVYGNIDGQDIRACCPKELSFSCEGVQVYMTHICGYPEHYNAQAKMRILQERPQIVVAGHSHILKVMYDKKLAHLHLNPGAAGKHGFHRIRTMLSFEIDGNDIRNMNVLEYPK